MKKTQKFGFVFMSAVLGAIGMFVGAGGCDDVQNEWNCSDLCNRYQDCFDKSYDTGACQDRCADLANGSQNIDERANACQDCMNENACVEATAFNCPSCTGIVP